VKPNFWTLLDFGKHEEPAKPPTMCGIYLSGRDYFLCSYNNQEIRGVKVVTVSQELYDRYVKAETDWLRVQRELEALPKSLRPRRRSTRKAKEPEASTG
jgi:hypothetical protein